MKGFLKRWNNTARQLCKVSLGNCKQVCITPIWASFIRAGDEAKEISRDRLQGILYGTLRRSHLTNQEPCLTTLNMEHEKRNESPCWHKHQ